MTATTIGRTERRSVVDDGEMEWGKMTPLGRLTLMTAGETYAVRLPWSEVCCHMRVADAVMRVGLRYSRDGYAMAQLYRLNGEEFSFPILTGEAGVYDWTDPETGERRHYCYTHGYACECAGCGALRK